jgi:type II secretory ATPase GspE/PulE/Tfp pilus assembly ATPase PilB-like protein
VCGFGYEFFVLPVSNLIAHAVRALRTAPQELTMSFTVQYLQSEMASQGVEVSVLVNCLVQDAINLKASDLHIEPWESSIAARARVNGVLVELAHLPIDFLDKISMRFKVMANLVTYQAGMPQDGTAIGGPELDGVQLRISIFPTTRGEKIVIRLFDPRDRRFDLGTLGFEESTLDGLLRALKRTSGLLLFTGPTGSGKTSTMYSALCHVMQREGTSISISTVEDPVEFNLPMVSQTQINPSQEFTYAVALRSIMRQDPEVIMVGEIRDPETAAIAVQAGLTGHLVISTIHAGVSSGAFTRLINMDIEPFMLASSVIAVVGLRLVRRVCANCSQPYEPAPSQLKMVPEPFLGNAQFRRGTGCDHCAQTGYSGRLPVSELLLANEPFREAVLKKVPTSALEQIAIENGMRTLWQNGLHRAITGQTTLEETVRVLAADMM